MDYILSYPLKVAKSLYSKYDPNSSAFGRNWKMFPVKNHANELIYDAIMSEKPLMVARLGSTELTCMVNYLGVKFPEKYKSVSGYIKDQSPAWWWNKSIINQMYNWSGFFPAKESLIEKFCEMMIDDMSYVDILGTWLKQEDFFKNELAGSKKVMLEDLEPFFAEKPWTRALEGKKVLVIHPFSEQIESQYKECHLLFDNQLLPDFKLTTIQAVQSLAGEKTIYKDWFEALDDMKAQIANADFDICILGCGAYGFPLAAYIKQIGKQAIHLGGVTQMLFGIKGARWENYIVYPYANLYNTYWVRPGEKGRPKNASIVEGACYW